MERSKLKKLGEIIHFSDLGNAIVKNPPKLPKIGSDVVNEKMVHIGRVNDIFGSVNIPYVSIRIKAEKKGEIEAGSILFSIDRRKLHQRPQKKKSRYSNRKSTYSNKKSTK